MPQEKNPEGTTIAPIVIKADVAGSLEAITHELEKIKEEKLKIKVLAGGVGEITEGDVKTAATADKPLIIGFNVKIDATAKAAAERLGVQVEFFDIIYFHCRSAAESNDGRNDLSSENSKNFQPKQR